jgi:hypothetical protein
MNQGSNLRCLGATRLLRPSLDVSPVPYERGFERRYRFREVSVAPSPFVDDLRSFNGEPLRDFVCADEVA